MLEFAKTDPGVIPEGGSKEMDQVWERIKGGKYVFMAMHTHYLTWRKKHCRLAEVREIVAQDMLTFALQKNSSYLKPINKM